MVTILAGPQERILRHPAVKESGPLPPALRLNLDPDFPVPWGAVRRALALLRPLVGEATLEGSIAPYRGPLSVVLRGLKDRLEPREEALRARCRAQALGFLSHNVILARPLIEAWAKALGAMLRQRPLTLVAPDLSLMDVESMAVLRELLRGASGDPPLRLVLGVDPKAGPQKPFWRRTYDRVLAQVGILEALPETQVVGVQEDAGPPASGPQTPDPFPIDPLDDGLEREAARLLAARQGAPDEEAASLIVAAIRASFEAYGFDATLRLGLGLLERRPDLAEAAEIHALVGLAAYNRQVETKGDPELPDFLHRHFSAALDREADPARRSHLLYRLCINAGRRKGAIEEALALGNRAVEEARRPGLPAAQAAYLEAWALNGRAYVHARSKRGRDAASDCETALQLLRRAAELGGAPPPSLT